MLKNWLRPDFSNQAVLLYGDGYDNYKPKLFDVRILTGFPSPQALEWAIFPYFAWAEIQRQPSDCHVFTARQRSVSLKDPDGLSRIFEVRSQ